MGLFDKFKKKVEVQAKDNDILAIANGKLIDITTVNDPIFSQKMMGEGIAFQFEGDKAIISAPVNGKLSVLFPTGHAFGIETANGVEFLVHIGINTVEANGKGFKALKKQGDKVSAGTPIVEVDVKTLSSSYDMTTMLVITNPNDKEIKFIDLQDVNQNQKIGDIL